MNTGLRLWIATDDLLTFDPDPNAKLKDDKFVKVLAGGEVRFVNKTKLPYVKTRWNSDRPYIFTT